MALLGSHGGVRQHRRDHHREVVAHLRHTGTDPHRDDEQLQREDHVHERENPEEDQGGEVLLGTTGDEDDLVAQTDHDEQRDQRVHEHGGVHQALVVTHRGVERARRDTREHDRDNQVREDERVDGDVERVRESPLVNGTLPGHGGSRMVLGRSQYRTPPVIGLK